MEIHVLGEKKNAQLKRVVLFNKDNDSSLHLIKPNTESAEKEMINFLERKLKQEFSS